MIVLDTNVISELFNQVPDPKVSAWISTLIMKDIFISGPTLMELWSGSTRLPIGKKRDQLEAKIKYITTQIYNGRILKLDERSAKLSGQFIAHQFMKGRKPSIADCQIAAIAVINGFAVATRDIDDFAHEPLRVINPWEVSA